MNFLQALSALSLLSFAGNALAGEPTDTPPPASSDSATSETPASPPRTDAAQSPKVKEATARFERGLALYDDGDYDAALVEFSRAYELSPIYKVLYNIAKIERVKNDYSGALTHFKHYLEQGGAEIPQDRQDEVQKEIAVLKERVAEVRISTNVEGAAIYVDDKPICGARLLDPGCVGTTPLRTSVIVNPGKRKFTAVKQGYQNADAQLTLAGGDRNTIKLDLFDLRPKEVDTGPRDRAIVSWVVTGALGIGAGVMGGLTLSKKNQYEEDLDKPGCASQLVNSETCLTDPAATLEDDKKTTQTFAVVTDVLLGATLVSSVFSIYFTVDAANSKPDEPERKAAQTPLKSLKVSAGLGSASLSGTF